MRRRLLVSLILGWLGLGSAAAEEFRFYSQPLEIPERGLVTSYVLVFETNRFHFLPPPNWQVKIEAKERRLVLTAPDFGAAMTLKIEAEDSPSTEPLKAEDLRPLVAARLPDGKPVRETPCFANGRQGLAFDVERPGVKGAKVLTRIAWVQFPGGRLESSLTALSSKFDHYRRPFNALLSSLRIEQGRDNAKGPPRDAPVR